MKKKRFSKAEFSNILLRRSTKAEDKVFDILVGSALRFHCQKVIGPFFVDFFIKKPRVIIEIDGGYHDEPRQKGYDARREAWLKAHYQAKVIRYKNEEVFADGFEKELTWRLLRMLPPRDPRAKARFGCR